MLAGRRVPAEEDVEFRLGPAAHAGHDIVPGEQSGRRSHIGTMTNREAAWDAVHEALQAGWTVGPPTYDRGVPDGQ